MIKLFNTAFLVLALVAMSAGANAQTVIGIVDVQKLMTQSMAAQDIQKQVESFRNKFQEEVSKKEQGLRESEKSLVEQRKTLPADKFEEKKKGFEKELLSTKKYVEGKKKNLNQATAGALEKLESQIVKIVSAIAKEKNFGLVITKQAVVVGDQALDITADVMTRLNTELSSVKMDVKSN
jgi:Skp family chaperone for outer membrane proteins